MKSLVRPYYRQNAGLMAFLIFIMVFAVGRANDAGLLEYHYDLIKGMLINPGFLAVVMVAWFLYAMKCQQFVADTLIDKEFSYLYLLANLNSDRLYVLVLLVQVLLFLPVSIYVAIMAWIGFHNHWYRPVTVILIYTLMICLIGARWYQYLLQRPRSGSYLRPWGWLSSVFHQPYWRFFTNYILNERKILFIGIKLYSAGTLYLMLHNGHLTEQSDLQLIYLFYSFGLFAHALLVHPFRKMEDSRLSFYRALPVSLLGRWIQYASLYFVIFIPELIVIGRLHLYFPHFSDAIVMAMFGYSILMLLNSLLFIQDVKMIDYLKMITGIFMLVFISVLTGTIGLFSVCSLILSVYLFFTQYYRYERVGGENDER